MHTKKVAPHKATPNIHPFKLFITSGLSYIEITQCRSLLKESHMPRVKHIVTTADKYFFTPKYNRIPPKPHSMLLDNPLKQ